MGFPIGPAAHVHRAEGDAGMKVTIGGGLYASFAAVVLLAGATVIMSYATGCPRQQVAAQETPKESGALDLTVSPAP